MPFIAGPKTGNYQQELPQIPSVDTHAGWSHLIWYMSSSQLEIIG